MSHEDIDFRQLLKRYGSLWQLTGTDTSNSQHKLHTAEDCDDLKKSERDAKEITHAGQLPLRPDLCSRCEARPFTHGIVVVGLPGAGKTEGGKFAAVALNGAHVIETGGVVRRGAAQFYQQDVEDLTSDQLGEYSTMRRERDGGDYVARDVIDTLETEAGGDESAVIIGMRDTEAIPVLEDYFDGLQIVWIHAPHDVRLERLQDRDRQDEAGFTSEDLQRRDGRESMWGTPEWAFHADVRVLNTGTLDHLRRRVETEVRG